jgi:hypothetical protein
VMPRPELTMRRRKKLHYEFASSAGGDET